MSIIIEVNETAEILAVRLFFNNSILEYGRTIEDLANGRKTKSSGIGALVIAWLDVCILFSLDTPVPPQGTVIFKPLGGLANRLEIVYL